MPDEARTGSMEAASGTASKPPEIVVRNKAFQVAQAWVKNMSGGADSDPEDDDEPTATEEFGGLRPARLGLGAKYLPHSKAAALMAPVEKKLRAKMNAARSRGDSGADQGKEARTSEPDSDEEGDNQSKDSKTSAFRRKQRNTSTDLLMPAGKRKRLGR